MILLMGTSVVMLQLINQLTSNNFIVAFIITRNLQHNLYGLTAKLQKRSLDWLSAHQNVSDIVEVLTSICEKDAAFDTVYDEITDLSEDVDVEIRMPRVASR